MPCSKFLLISFGRCYIHVANDAGNGKDEERRGKKEKQKYTNAKLLYIIWNAATYSDIYNGKGAEELNRRTTLQLVCIINCWRAQLETHTQIQIHRVHSLGRVSRRE